MSSPSAAGGRPRGPAAASGDMPPVRRPGSAAARRRRRSSDGRGRGRPRIRLRSRCSEQRLEEIGHRMRRADSARGTRPASRRPRSPSSGARTAPARGPGAAAASTASPKSRCSPPQVLARDRRPDSAAPSAGRSRAWWSVGSPASGPRRSPPTASGEPVAPLQRQPAARIGVVQLRLEPRARGRSSRSPRSAGPDRPSAMPRLHQARREVRLATRRPGAGAARPRHGRGSPISSAPRWSCASA